MRAAAHSALRAGLQPVGCDLFADEDLRSVADVLPLERYPHGLVAAAELAPAGPWMYTGALENYPDVVARISRARPLLGNAAAALELVRDPFHVRDILQSAELPYCNVRSFDDSPFADGRWLLKPIHSAGGARIQTWAEMANQKSTNEIDEDYYFQEWAEGTPMSAVFLAAPDATWLVGMSRQLIGSESAVAGPFAYCGSIGPVSLADLPQSRIEHIGRVIAEKCGLRGLFGIDFMFDGKDPWLTEVNPRYTASVEVLELALDIPLLGWHCQVCASFDETIPKLLSNHRFCSTRIAELSAKPPGQVVAKQIVYAGRECVVPSLSGCEFNRSERNGASHRFQQGTSSPEKPAASAVPLTNGRSTSIDSQSLRELTAENSGSRMPFLADIPAAGSIIPAGRPVCTVLATGSDFDSASQALRQRVSRVEAALQVFGSGVH